MDDEDIVKENRNLYARGNTIIRTFKNMNNDVKLQLFKTYCYPLYCLSLWSTYRVKTISRLRVGYNSIFRHLLGIRLWNEELERVESMSDLFLAHDIKSFPDLYKFISSNSVKRIENSENSLVSGLLNSDAKLYSRQWEHWERLVNTNQYTICYPYLVILIE